MSFVLRQKERGGGREGDKKLDMGFINIMKRHANTPQFAICG
jgi:hypothetical protein